MPEIPPDQLVLLELDAAWEAFSDANPDSMNQLKALSESSHLLLELAFKAGYTSGAAMQLLQFRKMHIDNMHPKRGSNDE
jgi:hypothetical protein